MNKDTTQPREQAANLPKRWQDRPREVNGETAHSAYLIEEELREWRALGASLIQQAASETPTLQNWLKIIHDDELTPGDRLQRISSRIQALLASPVAAPEAPTQTLSQFANSEHTAATTASASDLEAALDEEYPLPNSPHASVNDRAYGNRSAFERGWNAARRAALTQQSAAGDATEKKEQK